MILGITGNIASGKSTVAHFFAEAGASVLSADQLAREVVLPGSPVLQQLVDHFGMEILQTDGQLDRNLLGKIIFSRAEARQELNAITHPAIACLAETQLRELDAGGEHLVVYESPLLFEAGVEGRVDLVLMVTVDPQVQLHRLIERDGLGEMAARERINAQQPQQEKVQRADFVLDNSTSLNDCRKQVMALAAELYSRIPARPENR